MARRFAGLEPVPFASIGGMQAQPAEAATPRFSLLPPLRLRNGVARALSAVATIAILLLVGRQLANFGFGRLFELLPSALAVFVLLLALHVLLPISEWFIYRRLWALPAAGIAPLLRKGVINDLVLSYGGELYLYDWARRRMKAQAAPFQAIKDVSILSAMVANVATVAMVVVAAPWVAGLIPSGFVAPLIASVILLLGIPLLVGLFANRVFSLTRSDIRFVSAVHAVRIAATVVLTGALWTWMLPGIAFHHLLALQTLRLLVSRAPLVPNHEILFASVTILIAGQDSDISAVAALTAMALVAFHFATFALLLLGDLVTHLLRDRHAS